MAISFDEVKTELFEAQKQINQILYTLNDRVGVPVDIETLVRYGKHSKGEYSKQPIVLLSIRVDVN